MDDDLPPRPRHVRLALFAVPLSAMAAAPAMAAPGQAISICTAAGERVIYLPAGRLPPVPADRHDQGCAHAACLRDQDDDEATGNKI